MIQGRLFCPITASPTSSYLDPLETAVDSGNSAALLQLSPIPYELVPNFRHSGWASDRRFIFRAFQRLLLRYNRIESFRTCGSGNWILRSKQDPQKFRVVPDFCHDRWCVPCSRLRQLTIRQNLNAHLGRGPFRFLTLTIRHGSEPLSELIAKLYSSFRKLRQRAIWKDNVNGGVSFLELTYNSVKRSWHPHLHCVLAGSYIHRPALVISWFGCTGDSTGVDIRLVRDRRQVIEYVSKYVTKPLPGRSLSNNAILDEAISCLIGRRMLVTFGIWKSWKLTRPPENEEWDLYCHENALSFLNERFNPEADNVRSMLGTADPRTGIFWVVFDDIPP